MKGSKDFLDLGSPVHLKQLPVTLKTPEEFTKIAEHHLATNQSSVDPIKWRIVILKCELMCIIN